MVYIAYFTELNSKIWDYAQKRRICRENCKYAPDERFHGHFCPRRKPAKSCHPVWAYLGHSWPYLEGCFHYISYHLAHLVSIISIFTMLSLPNTTISCCANSWNRSNVCKGMGINLGINLRNGCFLPRVIFFHFGSLLIKGLFLLFLVLCFGGSLKERLPWFSDRQRWNYEFGIGKAKRQNIPFNKCLRLCSVDEHLFLT